MHIQKTSKRERERAKKNMHIIDIQKASNGEKLYAYNGHSKNIKKRERERDELYAYSRQSTKKKKEKETNKICI